MEDPIRFDVWATVRPGSHKNAVHDIVNAGSELTELEIRNQVNRSARDGKPILVLRSLGWSRAKAIREKPASWMRDVLVYQEGEGPRLGDTSFCKNHNLYYAGVLGCHVCTGFYQDE